MSHHRGKRGLQQREFWTVARNKRESLACGAVCLEGPAMSDSPVGSIIAFGGRITHAWENANGWLHCNGRLLDNTEADYRALFEAIAFSWGGDGDTKFNLPDLQGIFLRGVDWPRNPEIPDLPVPYPGDPDHEDRLANRPGGNLGNLVGSVQRFGTALPSAGHEFKAASGGLIDKMLPFEVTAARDVNGQNNTVAYPNRPDQPEHAWLYVDPHEHEITGGNKETRPVNAYVHWIIRYK
jgi:hypothetical protein